MPDATQTVQTTETTPALGTTTPYNMTTETPAVYVEHTTEQRTMEITTLATTSSASSQAVNSAQVRPETTESTFTLTPVVSSPNSRPEFTQSTSMATRRPETTENTETPMTVRTSTNVEASSEVLTVTPSRPAITFSTFSRTPSRRPMITGSTPITSQGQGSRPLFTGSDQIGVNKTTPSGDIVGNGATTVSGSVRPQFTPGIRWFFLSRIFLIISTLKHTPIIRFQT